MKKFMTILLLAVGLSLSSFASTQVNQTSLEKMERAVSNAAFAPAIHSVTGVWEQTSNPYIYFTLSLVSTVSVQTQYYVDITYYTDFAHAGTTTISWQLFYVNAGHYQGFLQYNTTTQFYGVKSWVLELTNP